MSEGTVATRLAGSRVLLTGVTGFVGEALLRLLLAEAPEARVVVLVRPKGSQSGADRIRKLLEKDIFDDLGGPALLDRVAVLEGDLADPPPLPDDLDAVVHCAGDVSFDPPVDEGFRTNVVGTQSLLARVREVGDHVHYVHVSTAYVAGRRQGHAPEAAVEHDVDVETELDWGLSQRRVVEQQSRSTPVLARLRAEAEKQHSRAGSLSVAAATEQARQAWVRDRLVEAGGERARSLGWTDCYTFTKALGERVVEEHARRAPTSIVRPSIVESALETPYPGWIEGFKMAEPLILAYGRGELPEFPAAPDTIIDIIPVDHVVAATVAVLATPPEPGAAAYFHVASGSRNPLTFRVLYDAVRGYFDAHPFQPGDRGAARLPDWRFPGARAVERLLSTSERAHRVADRVLERAPRSDRTRDLARRLDRQGRRLESLRRYLDIYREYAVAELHFDDTNTAALFGGLTPEDRERFGFDVTALDWQHYLAEVHCPAVTAPLRRIDEVRGRRRRTGGTAALPKVIAADRAEAPPRAAFFDMDGTLLSSNVIETYLWMRLPELDGQGRFGELARIGARVPGLLQAERHDRATFLRSIYREYAGARLADLDAVADEVLTSQVLARLSAAAVRRVREHRAAGHRTVLITGAVRPLTRPLAPLFDHVEAADLAVDDRGVCTGFLAASPLVGEARAAWIRRWAGEHDIDLSSSYGYADSHSDLPLLEAVGNPVAVSPDVTLFRHARRKHWPIADWESSAAAGRSLTPAGGG